MPDSRPLSGMAAGAEGTVRQILVHPDPALREICQPSGLLTGAELHRIAADLLASMYAAGGRGLAAPQIGLLRRIFVMDAGWKLGRPDPQVFCDPDILFRADETARADERCLSIPDQAIAVTRPVEVILTWYDLSGREHSRRFSGDEARIIQHEVDHLDGRLILDAPR